jgi:hypothetical protein
MENQGSPSIVSTKKQSVKIKRQLYIQGDKNIFISALGTLRFKYIRGLIQHKGSAMIRKSLVLAVAVVFFAYFAGSAKPVAHAAEMELTTPDGVAIILKPDSTWSFKNNNQEGVENDFTVPVNNGKIIKISHDQTWSFVKKEIIPENKILACDSVSGKGHSINPDINTATDVAQKQAMQEISTKVKIALKNIKIDAKKLPDCIKDAHKDVSKNEDFKKNTGWEVSVLVKIDKTGLMAISDCAKKSADTSAMKKK